MNNLNFTSFINQVFQFVARILALFIYGNGTDNENHVSFKRGISELFEFLTDTDRAQYVLSALNKIETKLILMLEDARIQESRLIEVRNQLAVSRECVKLFAEKTIALKYIVNSDGYAQVKDTGNKIEMIQFICAVSGYGLVDANNAVEEDLAKTDPCL